MPRVIGSLHDLDCKGPSDCTCSPVRVRDQERVEVVDDAGSVWIFRDRISDEPGPILKPTPKAKVVKRLKSRPRGVPTWIREAVFQRDGYLCQLCEQPGGSLDPHHRLARSAGGKDSHDNLVSLHRKCHRYVHANPIEARRRGLIVGMGSNG